MAEEVPNFATTSQITTLRHEMLMLQQRLTDTQVENLVLRQQLHRMSSLLDMAVSKLGTMGVAIETPLDIRKLRADVNARTATHFPRATNAVAELPDRSTAEESSPATKRKHFQLRTQLTEHTKSVLCCAFAPDEYIIATGGLDRRLIVQNFFNGKKLWDVSAHDDSVVEVGWFNPYQLLSASYDGTVKVWDTRKSEAAMMYEHRADAVVLSAIPLDKAFVFACSDIANNTSIVDVRSAKPLTWKHSSRANSLTYDSSNGTLVMGHVNGSITAWDMRHVGVALSNTTTNNSVVEEFSPSGGAGASAQVPTQTPQSSVPTTSTSNSAGAPGLTRLSKQLNDESHAAVWYVAHFHSKDYSKRLITVSGDRMVRLFRGHLRSSLDKYAGGDLYQVRNLLPRVEAYGFNARAGFWKGIREKGSQASVYFDDGEKDREAEVERRMSECDLVVMGGPENTAAVYDVSDEGGCNLVELLDGHRDRVSGACFHPNSDQPIIATTSSDSTVRIWVTEKKQ